MNAAAETATVAAVVPTEGAVEVAVRFDDGRIERARVRPDLVPDGLKEGDRVALTRAALYRRWRIEIL